MAIQFQKIRTLTFNMAKKKLTGLPAKMSSKGADIGIPTEEFEKQVIGLINKKTPLEEAFLAIDRFPKIHDKVKAKEMAKAIYQIMDVKPPKDRSFQSPKAQEG